MSDAANEGELIIDRIRNAAGLILGVFENRSWIEFFFEGDLMHTQAVNRPETLIVRISS